MKRNILGMVLGLATIAAPAAADVFPLGDLTNVTYGNTESFRQLGGGEVSSSYSFTLSQSSIVHLTLTDTARLTGLTASLYNVAPTGNTLETAIGPLASNGAIADWLSPTALGPGNYKVDVVGAYASRGSYALQLSSEVAAPVPGPAGFLVAGAGALVVAARRRRQTRNAALA